MPNESFYYTTLACLFSVLFVSIAALATLKRLDLVIFVGIIGGSARFLSTFYAQKATTWKETPK